MTFDHNGVLMRIYLSQSHRYRGKSLFVALVDAMLAAGLQGATTFIGAEGFGSHRRFSSDMIVDAPGDLPILIEVVDHEERLRSFLPTIETMLADGLVTVERIFEKRITSVP